MCLRGIGELPDPHLRCHSAWKPLWCQPITVAGFTMTRTPAQSNQTSLRQAGTCAAAGSGVNRHACTNAPSRTCPLSDPHDAGRGVLEDRRGRLRSSHGRTGACTVRPAQLEGMAWGHNWHDTEHAHRPTLKSAP